MLKIWSVKNFDIILRPNLRNTMANQILHTYMEHIQSTSCFGRFWYAVMLPLKYPPTYSVYFNIN